MNPELTQLTPGDLVQLDPEHVGNQAFAGCILQVTEVRAWGVQGFVQALGETRSTPGGRAYYRARWEEIEPTGGRAVWVPGCDGEEEEV